MTIINIYEIQEITMNAQSISVFTVVCMCASAVLPATAAPPTSLKLVHVIYRHGDRSPFSVFPNDRNKAEVWGPDGLNWLTNLGAVCGGLFFLSAKPSNNNT